MAPTRPSVARLEREAFGAGAAEPAEDAAHRGTTSHAAEGSRDRRRALDFDAEPAAEAPPAAEPRHDPLARARAADAPVHASRSCEEAERREAPAAPERPSPSRRAREPEPEPPAEPADHDELEETPEFLQETPEHDKLWFEQKPPKDFDF